MRQSTWWWGCHRWCEHDFVNGEMSTSNTWQNGGKVLSATERYHVTGEKPAGGSAAMETTTVTRHEHYLNVRYGLKSWLLTVDHKRIALLYLVSITFFFFIGGTAATLIRLELMTPQGDLVQSETYNKLFTMHGIIMIFFFLIPSIPAVLGNFLVPMMLGARDLAFPRLNLLSWYVFTLGGLLTLSAMIAGGVDTGWTFYTP
jgi:cytochrome c oxidase subunit I